MIFPLRNNIVYLNFTGYQMKAYNIDLIFILINENFFANRRRFTIKIKIFCDYFFKKSYICQQ